MGMRKAVAIGYNPRHQINNSGEPPMIHRRFALAGRLLLALALAATGAAQAKGSHHKRHRPPANVSGRFDYYVMSLSWSPTFCETHQDNPQCGQHFGFVLHGLWPQYESGGYPQDCATSERLTDEARTLGLTVFPTEQLMAHEWQKHGTCSGSPALAYFRAAESAHASVKLPPELEPGSESRKMTGAQIARLVRDANPAITGQGLALVCDRQELTELRVCLSKDLSPRACGRQVNGSCGAGPVQLPGAR
jgi:ribonuclease T2